MRRKTLSVRVGNTVISSGQPVVVQSMLNTSTMDTEVCVNQAIRIIEAGGQLVRITAQGVKEAENLKNIREELRRRGYETPLSADIHFNPEAASVAARYVEKVRINPGNFVDKRATFQNLTYTEEEYRAELAYLRSKFTDFLTICRQYHTAVRIGTNHGSLSDRIMSRYGNTPAGMVEATMEYLRVCRDTDFNDVVISLKSSDCRIMITAVRLLVEQMQKEGMNYPLHLGVTEAGEGEDGRIRSAVGIGCLLNEGVGDTIRVSLTEAPEAEIPVARELVALCRPDFEAGVAWQEGKAGKPFIVADSDVLGEADCFVGEAAPEMIFAEAGDAKWRVLPDGVTVIVPWEQWEEARRYRAAVCPLIPADGFKKGAGCGEKGRIFVEVNREEQIDADLLAASEGREVTFVLSPQETDYHAYRRMIRLLGYACPVIIRVKEPVRENVHLKIAAHVGGIFMDKWADGLWITLIGEAKQALELSRNILQSAGVRRYKTEFVSCPGCGRTLYNLEDAVAKVKRAFAHLTRLKIAIMGCIVNGPGEMGDADYGYVGAGNGKVNLYKGKQRVKTAVPEEEAIDALKSLIAECGDWKEPE
ncbi:(E)-4-hydroxy-3-methylbut-2-enyl-diphosphate synthase [Odoribacter lunatus]|uniref:(E)-4-hydroxy-3-methylbut-2-enyl-diphosphate synthase n=1 Tax=Odoribacter lunatus TaxID=2941335 RepID=UPI00203F36E4|nr:(E)-4-hydroxy-3-methylbut-2-enyl-diphosphate synthase [Odoribacter lunatus]